MITAGQAAEIAADARGLHQALYPSLGQSAWEAVISAMPVLVRNVLDGPVAAQDEPPHP